MKDTICVIASHPSSDLHVKCISSNIKYFDEISDKIVIVLSREFQNDDTLKNAINKQYPELNIEYHYFANTANLCHGKWTNYMQNIYDFDYSNIILTNDSFLVINSLKSLKDLHDSDSYEMTGLVSSREGQWHCQDFLRIYRNEHIKKLINFYNECNARFSHFHLVSDLDNKRLKEHYDNCVGAERQSCQLFSKQSCLFTLPLSYKRNINFDNDLLKEYIEKKNYPIVKIRKLNFTFYEKDYSEKLPENFDHLEYKKLNTDLPFSEKESLENHFMKHGHFEGRLYGQTQKINLPDYIKNAIKGEIDINE